MSSGRAFHVAGPAWEKARSLHILSVAAASKPIVRTHRHTEWTEVLSSRWNENKLTKCYLKELDTEFSISEDVHASQVSDNSEARGQLHIGAQLMNQLRQHQLRAGMHLQHYVLHNRHTSFNDTTAISTTSSFPTLNTEQISSWRPSLSEH